jgi:ArsR family transcriptional regulator, arsenate/arsenite/antimonite-responsive transcriptional repressor
MRGSSTAVPQQQFFRTLADRTRLRLLNLMGEKEVCVCYFVAVLKLSQPKISRHLAYLRRAGIVGARRQGKWMHYRLLAPSDPRAARILQDTLDWLQLDPEMQRDAAHLVRACCRRQAFVQLQDAPLPAPVSASTPAPIEERLQP